MSGETQEIPHAHSVVYSPKFSVEVPRGPKRPRARTTWQKSKPVARAVNSIKRGRDRGDVPGWVLITLMTAGLVVAIWAIAGPALEGLFNDAISNITNQAG
jgi:hypothetical protein